MILQTMHSFQLLHPVPSSSLTLQFLKYGGIHFISGDSKILGIRVHNKRMSSVWGGGETWHCIWLIQGEGEIISMEQTLPHENLVGTREAGMEAGNVGEGFGSKGG